MDLLTQWQTAQQRIAELEAERAAELRLWEMKPTIDPISGMPYPSHVNDIETIAALRAENERLRAEIDRLTRERDGIETARGVWQKLHAEVTSERDQLREQLAAAHTRIEELQNVVQVAAFALAKREPEPLTETRTK